MDSNLHQCIVKENIQSPWQEAKGMDTTKAIDQETKYVVKIIIERSV